MKTQGKIQSIDIGHIGPSKTNPRKHFNDADIAELAESIKVNGLQQPIVVRLIKEPNEGMYEIIDGERRYRACLSSGVTTVGAEVREMTDAEVLEYQLMTFLHRKDITPLEEAGAFQDLSKQGLDPESIAARIGKPVHHIVRTLRLLKLVPAAMKSLQKGDLPIAHAFEICRLQPKDQELVMENVFPLTMAENEYVQNREVPLNLTSLKNFIQERIHLDLRKISFSKSDPALVPKAGPCTHCVKRTGFNQGLFPDIQQSDTCTDPTCFKEKVEAHIAQQKSKLKAEKVKVIEFTPEYSKPADHPNAITCRSYKEVKGKPCKYAVQGIAVDGQDRGKLTTICNNKECSQHWRNDYRRDQALEGKKEKQKTPAQLERERIAKVKKEMDLRTNELLWERILKVIGAKFPKKLELKELVQIAAFVADNEGEKFVEQTLRIKLPWGYQDKVKTLAKKKQPEIVQVIHAALLGNDVERMLYTDGNDILVDRAKEYGVDVEKLRTEAAAEAEREFAVLLKPQTAAKNKPEAKLPEKEEEE